jgi:hypothetical protein
VRHESACFPHPGQHYTEDPEHSGHWPLGSAERCPGPKMPAMRCRVASAGR